MLGEDVERESALIKGLEDCAVLRCVFFFERKVERLEMYNLIRVTSSVLSLDCLINYYYFISNWYVAILELVLGAVLICIL